MGAHQRPEPSRLNANRSPGALGVVEHPLEVDDDYRFVPHHPGVMPGGKQRDGAGALVRIGEMPIVLCGYILMLFPF